MSYRPKSCWKVGLDGKTLINKDGEKMNIYISGGNGMLGSSLGAKLSKENFVIKSFSHTDLDVTNNDLVKKVLEESPDVFIHTAAWTNVDACEIDKNKATQININGTENLVNALGSNTMFIYISSTGIYGNYKNTPYTENDNVKPTTIYHKTKYEGELVVKEKTKNHLILRTGWLYGGDATHKKNFVYKRYLEGTSNNKIYGDKSQSGCPTYVDNLANQISFLLDKKITGTFNCVDTGFVTRFEYVKEILDCFNLKTELKAAPQNMYDRIAKISHNEGAINQSLNDLNLNIMKNWKESLHRYIENLKKVYNY